MFGVDYVSGPTPAQLKAANVGFVCRYLSYVNSATAGKVLTANEALALEQEGISVVSNYEWYANRVLEGFLSGTSDAKIAEYQHAECGGSPDRPIYFSVDMDVSGDHVADYFKGVASVIGLNRTGAYGSYRVLNYLFNAKLIAWGWQTYAWSYGAWEPRAHIEQYQNSTSLYGHSVDFDRSMKSDFGQWLPGKETKSVSTFNAPAGWRDDGKTLWCPNDQEGGPEVPIVGLIREYIGATNWPHNNVALGPVYTISVLEENNEGMGGGQQQLFRFSALCIPNSGKWAGTVVFEWDTRTLLYLRKQVAALTTSEAALHVTVASLQKQLADELAQQGIPESIVNARLQAAIQLLQEPLVAA